MKNMRGITLITLVITIVVLLIIIGVTLNSVFNEKIIEHTDTAKIITETNSILQELKLQYLNFIRTNPNGTIDNFLTYIETKNVHENYIKTYDNNIEIDGYVFLVTMNENEEFDITYVQNNK